MKETSKLNNLSENLTLKNLAQELSDNINKKVSATALTGTDKNVDIMKNFRNFIENDRLNYFEVEDYYL